MVKRNRTWAMQASCCMSTEDPRGLPGTDPNKRGAMTSGEHHHNHGLSWSRGLGRELGLGAKARNCTFGASWDGTGGKMLRESSRAMDPVIKPCGGCGVGKAGDQPAKNQARSRASSRLHRGRAAASQMRKLCSHFTGHLGVNLQRGSGGKLGT